MLRYRSFGERSIAYFLVREVSPLNATTKVINFSYGCSKYLKLKRITPFRLAKRDNS